MPRGDSTRLLHSMEPQEAIASGDVPFAENHYKTWCAYSDMVHGWSLDESESANAS